LRKGKEGKVTFPPAAFLRSKEQQKRDPEKRGKGGEKRIKPAKEWQLQYSLRRQKGKKEEKKKGGERGHFPLVFQLIRSKGKRP